MIYQLHGFENAESDTGFDAERSADTLKEARKQARYMLSNGYWKTCEASSPITKVQIWKGETLIDEVY